MSYNEPNKISFASYLLNLCIKDKTNHNKTITLGEATGFVYKKNGKQYLVTNLHVISGRNHHTGEILDIHQAIPEFLILYPSFYDKESREIRKTFKSLIFNLYDGNNMPTWLIHPNHKRNIDIAVLPLNNLSDILFAINDIPCVNAEIQIADDVFVIGYPLALGTNENKIFPIWKRASIASEPSVNYFNDDRKAFVIDGTTRSGMSGSPVFFYSNFTKTLTQNGGISFNMSLERDFTFLGIYSGRLIGKQSNDESFLGLVWKKELIDEIIDGNVGDDAYE